jgi:hypothetical protein
VHVLFVMVQCLFSGESSSGDRGCKLIGVEINLWLSSAVVTQPRRRQPVRSMFFILRNYAHHLPDLTKYGSHVYVLVRRGELRASKIMAKRLMNHPKIV